MSRHLRPAGRNVALVLGALALTACVENQSSVVILRNQVPTESCTASSSGGYRSMGVLDISPLAFQCFTPQYFMFPLVQNNLTSTVGTHGIELNYISIKEARIDLDLGVLGATVESSALRFRYPAFVMLAPEESASLQVPVIPTQTADLIRSAVASTGAMPIIRVRLKFAYEHGGLEQETHQIEYPIQLCDECLITADYQCAGGDLPQTIPQGNACNPTQDDPLLCCYSTGECPVCPATDTSSGT
jgi:hypothetical protein